VAENEIGLLVTIRGSKTDQERQGETIAIARGRMACPVQALRAWLDVAGIEAGPIFRPIDRGGTVRDLRLTCRSIANIVKAAERAGLDSASYSGHSLRSGFLTSAAGNGASIFKMMDVSRICGTPEPAFRARLDQPQRQLPEPPSRPSTKP
jgi:hypothetical protein